MSKNITIKEDGTPKNFNSVEVTRTDKQDGGSVDWVPEDETKLGIKFVTDNGEYEAKNDGLYGYSEVRTKGLKEGSEVRAKSKSIDANGTYSAEQDGLYGYTIAYVRVRGGGSYTNPDTGEKETPEPGVINGCAVGGIDEDGDETIVTVQDGKLIEKKAVKFIQIDNPPYFRVYNDGESINLFDAVVRGYSNNGAVYHKDSGATALECANAKAKRIPARTEQYEPDGEWYDAEVMPSPKKAKSSLATKIQITLQGELPNPNYINFATVHDSITETFAYDVANNIYLKKEYSALSGAKFAIIKKGYKYRADTTYYMIVAGGNAGKYKETDYLRGGDVSESTVELNTSPSYTLNNKTVYYRFIKLDGVTLADWFYGVTYDSQIPTGDEIGGMAWVMIYGEEVKREHLQTIELSWHRPNDNKKLTVEYDITVESE